jgi:hypothetical protein
MGSVVLNKLGVFKSFRYDTETKTIIHQKSYRKVDIDEFLEIQYLLDLHRITYKFGPKYSFKIL